MPEKLDLFEADNESEARSYPDQRFVNALIVSLRQSLRRKAYGTGKYEIAYRVSTLNLALVIFVVPLSTLAQGRFDVTPMVGYSSSVSFPLTSDTNRKNGATIDPSGSFGIGAGVRYDDQQVIEFHYSRQSSTMRLEGPALSPVFSSHSVLQHYLCDFTHEFVLERTTAVRPFLTASVGMTRITAAEESYNRFAFGIGGGVKWFPLKWFGIRAQGQWLPTLIDPEIKGFICAGGCVVTLGGKLADQAMISFGPIFTF